MEPLLHAVETVMVKNRRRADGYQYTVPSPELYPFQWLWDSCFHAIILSKFDLQAAKEELRSALSRPLQNGMLPHIIYWESPAGRKNWGRELRGDIITSAWGVDGTSAVTQPPIMAKTAHRLYACDGDLDYLRSIYGALRDHHRYLRTERSLRDDGLVFIINPDESGEDNSPRFDAPQMLPPIHTADENLNERIRLMRENVVCHFDAKTCMFKHFSVVDVSFNVIYIEALESMAALAKALGYDDEYATYVEQATQSRTALLSTLCHDGLCRSYDLRHDMPVPVDTWNLFMPLYGGLLTKEEASRLVEDVLLDRLQFWTEYPVPTVSQQDRAYDLAPDAFWRGPVWMAPNWFIYHGLRRYGYDDIARTLKEKSMALIHHAGFREHYHPRTGKGLGARDFTWAGLVLDME